MNIEKNRKTDNNQWRLFRENRWKTELNVFRQEWRREKLEKGRLDFHTWV